jgi:hypothetical protein
MLVSVRVATLPRRGEYPGLHGHGHPQRAIV